MNQRYSLNMQVNDCFYPTRNNTSRLYVGSKLSYKFLHVNKSGVSTLWRDHRVMLKHSQSKPIEVRWGPSEGQRRLHS